MKKTKKGLTLVEVLVAITVLSIIVFALLSTLVAMRKVVARQEEYVKIKMVCQDIDAYWEKYKTTDWADDYFNGTTSNNRGYLTADFKPTSNITQGVYEISFSYDSNDQLVNLSIIKESDKKVLVSGLDFPLKKQGEK
ncbi:MAG: prepilin-type N-terminal cleavage/methylation domain-containing protein [Clostridia bacterium]|nr:prepilin-type N-terminal cleavage/methylation domain-containing protein [Clostridia bacterium]